mmetsp:Transcript_30172/g.71105  ORF Transcript_30172/g.71105 Transcript_30172/m.71105 type:complete len:116 (+) Transcript_30172:549-896(+)
MTRVFFLFLFLSFFFFSFPNPSLFFYETDLFSKLPVLISISPLPSMSVWEHFLWCFVLLCPKIPNFRAAQEQLQLKCISNKQPTHTHTHTNSQAAATFGTQFERTDRPTNQQPTR